MSLLAVHDVHASYGSSRALFGISLEVAQGECVCLLGRNGVGKTTTMRAIMGLTPPSAGRVVWKGRGHRRAAAVSYRARRHRLRAGGPARVRGTDRCGKIWRSRARPPAARAAGRSSACSRCFPKLARTRRPARRISVRRRAADAHHRPHADGQSRIAAARRALRRACAAGGGKSAGADRRAQARRPHDPARRAGRRFFAARSPTASTCWKRAPCAFRARPPNCATTAAAR